MAVPPDILPISGKKKNSHLFREFTCSSLPFIKAFTIKLLKWKGVLGVVALSCYKVDNQIWVSNANKLYWAKDINFYRYFLLKDKSYYNKKTGRELCKRESPQCCLIMLSVFIPSDCTGTWGVCVAPYMLMDDAAVTHIPSGPPHTLLSAKKPSIWWSVG